MYTGSGVGGGYTFVRQIARVESSMWQSRESSTSDASNAEETVYSSDSKKSVELDFIKNGLI